MYSVAEASKNNTGSGEGVEVVKNEPFSDVPLLGGKFNSGQYTYKIYHLKDRVPTIFKYLIPDGFLQIHEEAWNAYPYCKTVLTVSFCTNCFILRINLIVPKLKFSTTVMNTEKKIQSSF